MKKYIVLMAMMLCFQFWGQSKINVMFYNLLDFPEAPPANRPTILKTILNEFEPDLFMVCELQSSEGANSILSTSFDDAQIKKANFVSNQSNPNVDLQQLVFYNSQKLLLENQSIITTHLRDINHYTFKLNTTDVIANPVFLEVFITHLKSSSGANNAQQRLDMVQDFTTTLIDIPKDHFIIFAGDLNLYTSQELAYQELLDTSNPIVLIDPVDRGGNWHNNVSYQDVHTQATRTSPIGNHGAGGGLDDRFDFILLSQNLVENNTLKFVNDSYETFGNNGNCFNLSINDVNCNGNYSQSLRNALYEMSDHLPIGLQLESSQTLSIDEYNLSHLIEFNKGNMISTHIELKIDPLLFGSKMVIYNILGQKMKSKTLQKSLEIIDATELNKGIFYILVLNEDINPLKFIKL